MARIIYTFTDEAPALATHSLLPIIKAFMRPAGIDVELRDISLCGRIMAAFKDQLPEDQQPPYVLADLGDLTLTAEANIIKLPNISASVPQLKAAAKELQQAGAAIPDYPDDPTTPAELDARARYDTVKGSAVNPVLRQGNSDRRAPAAVKAYARRFPHQMGAWSPDSQTAVATMSAGDFRSNEQSVTVSQPDTLTIRFTDTAHNVEEKMTVEVAQGTVVDATFMSVTALREFLATQIAHAKSTGLLFSLHLKATMMKVSDPIIFGHCVRAYFGEVFDRYGDALAEAGANANDGLADVLAAAESLTEPLRGEVLAAFTAALAEGPSLAMVDSDRGITNLHVPSDVIIDASMPAMIRSSGQMWGPDGDQHDTLAVIPDSSYAGVFASIIGDCRTHGAFDPTTMGSVPNVGLMAQKAEEYGSHDRTYELERDGVMEVVAADGTTLMSHEVQAGDIWRMCTVNAPVIENWVELALERATVTSAQALFWLDRSRPHDAELLRQVEPQLAAAKASGSAAAAEAAIMAPAEAASYSATRMREGKDTISVTGNVLRDYNTDLFPILELGTSAKMLSVVPLLAGGGLFETGAGGSAPKHVQQFQGENHLRWDSLGEFLALGASLEHVERSTNHERAGVLARTLDRAIETWLTEGRSPSRRVNEPDNRSSHYWLAAYWADELATQTEDPELASVFAPLASELSERSAVILDDLIECQGAPADTGGYYWLAQEAVDALMRPSTAFNELIDNFAIDD